MSEVVVVTGLGRCGSSMTMQMLAAGGMPCIGTFPDFEDKRIEVHVDSDLFAQWGGHAVKILDPHRVGIPHSAPCRVILLDRRHGEQARSIGKCLHRVTGMPKPRPSQIRRVQKSLARDMARIRIRLRGEQVLLLQFEETLADPARAARRIAAFVAPVHALDPDAMAAAVRPRPPQCAPGVDMELALAKEADSA